MVDPLSYFSFQPVLHDWCNTGCGMCYPVCGMVHLKEPLLLTRKSGFPLSLSECFFTIFPMPYNHKFKNVFSASFPSFLPSLKGFNYMQRQDRGKISYVVVFTVSFMLNKKNKNNSDIFILCSSLHCFISLIIFYMLMFLRFI